MIEPKLTFFKMQKERRLAHSTKPSQSSFRNTPETFDSIYMRRSSDKLIRPMTDPIMLLVSKVHKPFISLPAIRIDDAFLIDSPLDNSPKSASFNIWNDFSEDFTVSSVDTKNNGFPSCSTTSLSLDTSSSEVTFIDFNLPMERRFLLTERGDSQANFCKISVHGIAVETSYFGNLRGGQIEGEKLE